MMTYFLFSLCRCIVDPLRSKLPEDISKPLKNSFIHTGHGSAFGESWGSPSYIDDMYLKNPMEPPDILSMSKDKRCSPQFSDRRKILIKCRYCLCYMYFKFIWI